MALMTPEQDMHGTQGAKRYNTYSAEKLTAESAEAINANTDELETKIDSIIATLEVVTSKQTTQHNDLTSIAGKLDTIINKLDTIITNQTAQ